MAIDGFPPDVLDAQLASEERTKSPVGTVVTGLIGVLPSPLDKLGRFVARDREEKLQVMVDVLKEVLRGHEDQIGRLRAESAKFRDFTERDWPALVADGARKAEQTRAKDRVRRIATILGNSLLHVQPPSPDDVEEMMRVAMELGDADVLVLREFVRIEGPSVENPRGRINRYQAHNKWEDGDWRDLGVSEGDLQSICGKLEGFGLVSRLAPPNNLNIMADFENRYALLRKGLDFVKFIEAAAAQTDAECS